MTEPGLITRLRNPTWMVTDPESKRAGRRTYVFMFGRPVRVPNRLLKLHAHA